MVLLWLEISWFALLYDQLAAGYLAVYFTFLQNFNCLHRTDIALNFTLYDSISNMDT